MPATTQAGRKSRARGKGKPRGPEGSTSDAIYEAAEKLFFEFGYNGTSLRDIADEVGLQVGSLYNHIESKEQLLAEIMRSTMNKLLQAVDAATQDVVDPVEQLRAFMKATIIFHGENARAAFLGNTEMRSLPEKQYAQIRRLRDEFEHRLVFLLEQCRKTGVDISDVQMAAFACVAVCTHVSSWYRPDGRLTLDKIADDLAATYAPLADADRSLETPRPGR